MLVEALLAHMPMIFRRSMTCTWSLVTMKQHDVETVTCNHHHMNKHLIIMSSYPMQQQDCEKAMDFNTPLLSYKLFGVFEQQVMRH